LKVLGGKETKASAPTSAVGETLSPNMQKLMQYPTIKKYIEEGMGSDTVEEHIHNLSPNPFSDEEIGVLKTEIDAYQSAHAAGSIARPSESEVQQAPSMPVQSQVRMPSVGSHHVTPMDPLPENDRLEQFANETGFIWFYKKDVNPHTQCFGNYYLCPITYKGMTFQNVEAAFQAEKFNYTTGDVAKDARLQSIRAQFQNVRDGDAARALCAKNKADENPNWKSQGLNLKIMKEVLVIKFGAEPLKSALLATKNSYLVENTKWDAFWGDGLGETTPVATKSNPHPQSVAPYHGGGQNHLGRLLMQIRGELGGTGDVPPPQGYLSNVKNLR
jgi:ribA/ribD-fused uncharacterized protein